MFAVFETRAPPYAGTLLTAYFRNRVGLPMQEGGSGNQKRLKRWGALPMQEDCSNRVYMRMSNFLSMM